ncbi:NlpC/P60 family protein [Solicola sp. PLA-1-18]|uniref:C40 family peptidase n=1 Tax=Solicola sp. PLA-1-18 TaxID=3380532 RepID=UPI003B7B11BF
MRTGRLPLPKNVASRAIAVVACLAAGAAVVATPSTSAADPATTTEQAREQVETAHHKAEQALERYLAITDQLDANRTQVKAIQTDVEKQQKSFDVLRGQMGATIANQLTDSPMGPTAQLIASDDPDAFLDGLSALQAYNTNQSDRLATFGKQAAQLKVRKAQLKAKTDAIKTAQTKLEREKDTLDRRAKEADAVLASLTAAERAAVDAAENAADDVSDEAPPADGAGSVDASGKAKKAIDFALSQLGDPYRYGGTGPDSWDCSGLTGGAWRAAGVSLPRSSGAQAGAGSPVSRSDMQPGDLVFYYSPVSHVGLYLGGRRLVHAPRTGKNVEIVSVDSMPINSVRRVG